MQTPIDAATPLTVIMTAQEWNLLLHVLDEVSLPKRITLPLAQKLEKQLLSDREEAEYLRRPNGSGEARAP